MLRSTLKIPSGGQASPDKVYPKGHTAIHSLREGRLRLTRYTLKSIPQFKLGGTIMTENIWSFSPRMKKPRKSLYMRHGQLW